MEPVIFMFCLTLHNTEEALWFTEWRRKTFPNRRIANERSFLFALIGITVMGYSAAGLRLLYPGNIYFGYVFTGFVGAMLINAVMPHLLLTVFYRTYCPGVFTGCFLIIPFHFIILYEAITEGLALDEVIISTLIIGVVLLLAIPLFKWIAQRIFGE